MNSSYQLEFTVIYIYEQSEYESAASIKVSHDVHVDHEKNQLMDDQLHTNDGQKFLMM